MKAREKYVVMKKNFKVDILPEFVAMFKNSNHISCKINFPIMILLDEKGKSHMLIRHPSNKRRKEEESKDAIIITNDLEQENKLLFYEIDRMKEELSEFENMKLEVSYYNDKFDKLFEAGIVDKELNLKK